MKARNPAGGMRVNVAPVRSGPATAGAPASGSAGCSLDRSPGPSLALVAFDEAGDERLRGEYTLTDANRVPPDWQGGTGRVDAEMIAKAVPDYRERTLYLSGPRPLGVSFEEVLRNIGIRKGRIKTDFFPGFA